MQPSPHRQHSAYVGLYFFACFLGYSLARSGNALIRADGHIPILSRWLSWHQGCTFDLLQLTARTVRISPHRRSINSDLPSDRILFAIQTGRVFIIRLSRNTTTAAECVRSCSFTSWLRCFNLTAFGLGQSVFINIYASTIDRSVFCSVCILKSSALCSGLRWIFNTAENRSDRPVGRRPSSSPPLSML